MSEQGEPKLTDEQRKEIAASMTFYLGTGADLFPNDATLFCAMADRLAWLEAERERLCGIIRSIGAVVDHTGSCYNCEAFGPPRCSRCTELLALVGEAAR